MRKHFIIIAVIGLLLYLPSLFGPFLWDDEDFVYANQYVKDFRLDKFFTSSITEGRNKGSNYFRPIQEIAYSTTHAVFGFSPFWFHLLNVLVHISAACAIYYFFFLLLKQLKNWNEKILSSHFFLSPPFLISLFFLIHPVQTEAVSYISGLSDPLYVLFGFLSLIFFVLKNERKNMIPLSLFFLILSILSKETGLVFVPLVILLSAVQQLNKVIISDLQKLISNSWKFLSLYVLTAVIYLWYHYQNINTFDIKSAWGNNPYANSVIVRLLTFVQNLFLYVQLLIFPNNLFMERDYSIQVQTNLINPHLIFFIIINFSIIFCFLKLKNKIDFGHFKLLIFCYLAFFTSFIPYSGIVLINGIFYEHFLYLPLVFFFGLFIFLIPKKKLFSYLIVGLLVLFALRNVSRQLDWSDSIRFYTQTLSHAPKSIRIINGLGMAQANSGDLDKAIQTYSTMIQINPKIPNAYHNMGNAYAAKGDLESAEKSYLKALEVDPNFLFSVQSLVNLYEQSGQKQKLQQLLQKYQTQK